MKHISIENIKDEKMQFLINHIAHMAYSDLLILLGNNGEVSLEFVDKMKIELEKLISRHVIVKGGFVELFDIKDKRMHVAIDNAAHAALREIMRLLSGKGSMSAQFLDQLKPEIEKLVSRHATIF